MKRENVQLVETELAKAMENEYEDIFCVDPMATDNKIWCKIGGIDAEVVIDSGSRYNIVDMASWIELKAGNIETKHRQKEV